MVQLPVPQLRFIMADRLGRRKQKQLKAFTSEIARDVEVIKAHPHVLNGSVKIGKLFDNRLLPVHFKVQVLKHQKADKENIEGIKGIEPVVLYFPVDYPVDAPKPYLRKDFRNNLPHINPFRGPAGEVSPCVYYGSAEDLIAQPGGIDLLLNQIVDWLYKAALGELINAKQGWEPQRRDELEGYLIIDRASLTDKAEKGEAVGIFKSRMLFDLEKLRRDFISGFVANIFFDDPCEGDHKLNLVQNIDRPLFRHDTAFVESCCVIAQSEGVIDDYKPNDVHDLEGLLALAKSFGCQDEIARFSSELVRHSSGVEDCTIVSLFTVLLLVKRPSNIIGGDSPFELLPYRVTLFRQPLVVGKGWTVDMASPVMALANRDRVSRTILAKLNGLSDVENGPNIHLLGCGSVGSKIALHLARSGRGPFSIYDNEILEPHNAARHALFDVGFLPGQTKVQALGYALTELDAAVQPINIEIRKLIGSSKVLNLLDPKNSFLIDATASIPVADQISSNSKLSIPVVQVGLYARGKLSFVAAENPDRSVRLCDFHPLIWDRCIDDDELSSILSDPTGTERVPVGQGCNSSTMIMADHVVSEHTSGMSAIIEKMIADGRPDAATLWLGRRFGGPGISWRETTFDGMICPNIEETDGWEIRISATAHNEIDRLAKEHSPSEHGGVLFGAISLLHRRMVVTRVLPAPEGSQFDRGRFVMSAVGLKETVTKLNKLTNGNLVYLGTWHSHPKGGGPSATDRTSAKEILDKRLGTPFALLIWTPDGYRAAVEPKA